MNMKRIRFEVSFDLPVGARVSSARAYVLDSIRTWRGSLKPPEADPEDPDGDPMFDLAPESVRVKRIGPVRSRRIVK